MTGARVTDVVEYHHHRGESPRAVRVVRNREPDGFRWKSAVGHLTRSAGRLRGRERMRIEEPVRELVLDLSDADLRKEVVLDARRFDVDLDRGEVLPEHTVGALRRLSFLTGTDVGALARYVRIPSDFEAPIDTAAVVLVGRAFSRHLRTRAHRAWLELPDPDGPDVIGPQQQRLAVRAERDADAAKRWAALARTLLVTRSDTR